MDDRHVPRAVAEVAAGVVEEQHVTFGRMELDGEGGLSEKHARSGRTVDGPRRPAPGPSAAVRDPMIAQKAIPMTASTQAPARSSPPRELSLR